MNSNDPAENDRKDVLAPYKNQFHLPAETVYFDGNSLGPLLKRVDARLQKTIRQEWGQELIASWNSHDWINLSVTVGEKIAPLVGANAGQVVCADSVSVNLFKLMVTALQLNPERAKVLSVEETFPTDLYMVQGLEKMMGSDRCFLESVKENELIDKIDERTNLVLISHVNFRTGYINDLRKIAEKAHKLGAMVLVDLSHSAGVLPIELDTLDIDFAVGCGYKFLNGGPGAPSFLYVNARLQNRVEQPLSGWMGHQAPFEFSTTYVPRSGIGQYQSGTPGILGLSALDEAMSLWTEVDILAVRNKSIALTEMFIKLVQSTSELQALTVVSPLDAECRGSQVSLAHEAGYAIVQALVKSGVICDFREPNILRFGIAPLYNSFEDVSKAVEVMKEIIKTKSYQDPAFGERNDVT
ncbi:MAG: kynureninase [Candidatus Azotimanducaceae bacterium]|jgi:kynureninase